MTNTGSPALAVGFFYTFRIREGEALVGQLTWTDGVEVIFTQYRYQVAGKWYMNRRATTGIKRSIRKFESIVLFPEK